MGADEALNAMIATDLAEYFGRGHVFQLPVTDGRAADFYTRVPVLFDDSATHEQFLARIEAGGEITVAEADAGRLISLARAFADPVDHLFVGRHPDGELDHAGVGLERNADKTRIVHLRKGGAGRCNSPPATHPPSSSRTSRCPAPQPSGGSSTGWTWPEP